MTYSCMLTTARSARRLTAALAALAFLAGAPAASLAQTTDAAETQTLETYGPETVLATVGSQTITLADLIAARGELPKEYQAAPDEVLFEQLLGLLIRDATLAEKATQEGLESSPRVAAQLRFARRNVLSRAAAAQMATSAAPEIADADLRARYEEEIGKLEPTERLRARHILLASEDEAKAVKTELDGGADFAELAKEKSTGPSGPNGGDLGFFQKGDMVPAFDAAVQALEVGQISDPVQTDFGWHVIKLEERGEAPPPSFEQVADLLRGQMVEEARAAEMESLGESLGLSRAEALPPASAIRDDSLLDGQ